MDVQSAPQTQLVVPGRANREPGTHNHRVVFCEAS
jgi:hypothetical protein